MCNEYVHVKIEPEWAAPVCDDDIHPIHILVTTFGTSARCSFMFSFILTVPLGGQYTHGATFEPHPAATNEISFESDVFKVWRRR